MVRVALAAVSFVTMFYPNTAVAWASAVVTVAAFAAGIWRHRIVAPPKDLKVKAEESAASGDIAPILVEARRDIG